MLSNPHGCLVGKYKPFGKKKTSLLRRLQAPTLPKEAPPIGKNHRLSKMAVPLEPLMRF